MTLLRVILSYSYLDVFVDGHLCTLIILNISIFLRLNLRFPWLHPCDVAAVSALVPPWYLRHLDTKRFHAAKLASWEVGGVGAPQWLGGLSIMKVQELELLF